MLKNVKGYQRAGDMGDINGHIREHQRASGDTGGHQGISEDIRGH